MRRLASKLRTCSDSKLNIKIIKRPASQKVGRFLLIMALKPKNIFLVFLFLAGGILYAQKETTEVLDAEGLKVLNISTDEVFRIDIVSAPVEHVKIKTRTEGEYFNNILIETSVTGNELRIFTKYPERLTGGFDKLSAHKVFSMKIELEIPEGMEVIVSSNIASLIATGNYESVHAGLKQGYCNLLDFSGKANINTYGGDILVETKSGIIEANSRHGVVTVPDFLPGRNPIKLTSIDGDITVRKTK